MKNHRRSQLHNVVARPVVVPCAKTIQWIIEHTHIGVKTIINETVRCIASFQVGNLETYYKFHRVELHMNNEWVRDFS